MKVTMELTLDGLVRALRARAHRMAEEIETGYADLAERDTARPKPARRGGRVDDDGLGGD